MAESMKHLYAKNRLSNWLRGCVCSSERGEACGCRPNRGAPEYGVFTEYPICLDKNGEFYPGSLYCWDEAGYDTVPSYQKCVDDGLLPVMVCDIVVIHKGIVGAVFEIVCKNCPSEDKTQFFFRMADESSTEIFTVDAGWILKQPRNADLFCGCVKLETV